MKREDWLKTLKSDKQTITWMTQNWDKIPEAKRRLLSDLKDGKKMLTMYGALGEGKGNDAYIDEIIKPEEGGSFIKLYGISYLKKGQFDGYKVFGMAMSKGVLSCFLWKIVGKSYIYSVALLIKFLFRRRAFITDVENLFKEINEKVLRNPSAMYPGNPDGLVFDIPDKEYNQFTKELRRALDKTLEEIKTSWNRAILLASKFILFFLEFDNQYGNRVQDAFGDSGDFFTCLKRLMSREGRSGISYKWKFYERAARVFFLFAPSLRKFIDRFMDNLDRDKIKMDEADWYFCLDTPSYNYGGISYEERMKLRKQADEQRGHVFLM